MRLRLCVVSAGLLVVGGLTAVQADVRASGSLPVAAGAMSVRDLAADADDLSPALCAPGDANREPGVQGDVPRGATPAWDCGVREVGVLPGADGAMAVAGDCAYTGGGAPAGYRFPGVRVIDVSDPTAPRVVRVLDTGSRELLAARITDERGILVTRHRDTQAQPGQVAGRDMLVDVWDIFADCTDPKLLGTLRFPTPSPLKGDPPGETGGPAHNLGLNPSATKVYGTLPLHEADISDLRDPSSWTVRDLTCLITPQYYAPHQTVPGLCEAQKGADSAVPAGPQTDHEPVFHPDGTRMYVGGQLPLPNSNALWVLDMTGADPRVVSVTEQSPGHSIDLVTVDGEEHLLHSNEIGGTACVPEAQRPKYVGMGDRAYVLDISDETAPTPAAEIILADSRFANCGADGNTGGPSTAYHDTDDPLDTTYGVIGFGSAGFRFFDLRTPTAPVEVAYYNHGSSEHTKPYVNARTGHVWVSDADGFKVLALEPHLRTHLGLDGPNTPPSRTACLFGGWRDYEDESRKRFRNQGDCVRHAETGR